MPSASSAVTSLEMRVTWTVAGSVRVIGGGMSAGSLATLGTSKGRMPAPAAAVCVSCRTPSGVGVGGVQARGVRIANAIAMAPVVFI